MTNIIILSAIHSCLEYGMTFDAALEVMNSFVNNYTMTIPAFHIYGDIIVKDSFSERLILNFDYNNKLDSIIKEK